MLRIVLLAALILQQSAQPPSRPTTPADPMPPPSMDYFIGTWSFDWNVPDSALGPGGKFKGTETYKKTLNGLFLESEIKGDGPEGPFEGRAIMRHNAAEKTVTRYEFDGSGMSVFKDGTIGGDLGGYYTIFWESIPVKKNGKTVKLRGKTLMLSPAHYRLQVEISVDGGPYTNFGSPWYRKAEVKAGR